MKFLFLGRDWEHLTPSVEEVNAHIKELRAAIYSPVCLSEEDHECAVEDLKRCEEYVYWSDAQDSRRATSLECMYPCAVCGLPRCSH